jgi:CDP-diacylglycerol--glycerol-3-phosphate 3-phosphatidyltransferase
MFDGRWRNAVDRSTGPVGTALHRRGITADVLTATGLISATATAWLVASGHLHLAIILLIVTGLHDLLDGPVAKAAGTASVRGAFFDSVTDRVADAVLMGGVAWYLIGRHEGHLAVLPLAVLGVTGLVSYQRAKAESLGLSAKGGLMERAERMILLGIAFLDSAFVVPVLWVLLALISMTAIGRFVKVWNAASGKDEVIRRRLEAWRSERVDSWRTWREGLGREGAGAGVPRREFARVSRSRGTGTGTGTSVAMARWRARRVSRAHMSDRAGTSWRAGRTQGQGGGPGQGQSQGQARTRGTTPS